RGNINTESSYLKFYRPFVSNTNVFRAISQHYNLQALTYTGKSILCPVNFPVLPLFKHRANVVDFGF
ncbi:15098_t:CDS:2, partial [Dentiscutata erythropus]